MKAIVTNELRKRLEFASKNGSTLAKGILEELKKDVKECFGDKNVNYFDSVRVVGNNSDYKSLSIKISVCTKSLDNEHFNDKGNPNAPWFRENRERLSVGTFVNLFKNIKYTEEEFTYFESAICVNDIVKYRVSNKMSDFEKAYNGFNYYPFAMQSSPLHNSCMRYEDAARNAADFYANFAGAKILIAEDSQGQILGRCIVWENVVIPEVFENTKITDRMYYAFEFVRVGMCNYSKDVLGIYIRKSRNAVGCQKNFLCLKESGYTGSYTWDAYVKVPQVKWHKKGAPYMDTFYAIKKMDEDIVLSNNSYDCLVKLESTSGYGNLNYKYCPNCGKMHYRDGKLCSACEKNIIEQTPFGNILKCKTRAYKGNKYPSSFFVNGKPSKHFQTWIGLQRIISSNPEL